MKYLLSLAYGGLTPWWPRSIRFSSLIVLMQLDQIIFLLRSSPFQSNFIVNFAFLAWQQFKIIEEFKSHQTQKNFTKIKNSFKLFLFTANNWSGVKCYKCRFPPPTQPVYNISPIHEKCLGFMKQSLSDPNRNLSIPPSVTVSCCKFSILEENGLMREGSKFLYYINQHLPSNKKSLSPICSSCLTFLPVGYFERASSQVLSW